MTTTTVAARDAYCCGCFTTRYGTEPDMGDADVLTWEPGTCARCGADQIVFAFTDDDDTMPPLTHEHYYDPTVSDWLCVECCTVTDFCTETNPT